MLKFWGVRSKDFKATIHQTLKMIQSRVNSNLCRLFQVGQGRAADFFLRPPTLTASRSQVLYSTDTIFTVLKDLNLLKKYTKNQKASYDFRLGLAQSNGPHLHMAYLVTVPFILILAVYTLSEHEYRPII